MKSYFHWNVDEQGNNSLLYTGNAEWLVDQKEPETHIHEVPRFTELRLMHHKVTKDELRYIGTIRSITALKFGSLPDEIEIDPGALIELGQMTWLKELEIVDEHLPIAELSFLEKLTSLETLNIESDLNDEKVRVIARRTSLRHLSLRGDISDDVIPGILALPHLESLNLVTDKLTTKSIVLIGQNRTIQDLEVGVGGGETFQPEMFLPLTGMPQLKRLSFGGTELPKEAIRAISKLSQLQYLSLSSIHKDAWPGLDGLQDVRNLVSLDLQWNGAMSGDMLRGLSQHPSLTRLLVNNIQDEAAIDVLKTLPKFKELITKNRHDSEIMKYARGRLPKVEIWDRK